MICYSIVHDEISLKLRQVRAKKPKALFAWNSHENDMAPQIEPSMGAPAAGVLQKPARSCSPQKVNALGGGPYKTAAATMGGVKRKRGDCDDAGQEELSKRDEKQTMGPMGAPAAGMRQEPARSHSPQKGIALGVGPYKTAAATKSTAKQRTREGGDARQATPSPHVKPNSIFRCLCLPGVYHPFLHDWSDAPEGAPDGIRYPTPTGRDEVAESVAGFFRRNPDGSLQKPPFGVPMLVWHGLVPPSPHHRSITSDDHTGAMGVRNGGRVGF